jgi:hypothetical protein
VACYKQLDSSVGEFGSYTLEADTAAIESDAPGDAEYLRTDHELARLDQQRDALAEVIKDQLDSAEFGNQPIWDAQSETSACRALISSAQQLASHLTS